VFRSVEGQIAVAALNILVVEDDPLIGLLLSEMLTELGFAVCAVATTEDEAVALAALYRPGLLIVDQHLKQGSGISAMQRIARDGPIPCVFMSGAPADGTEGIQMLQKPFLEADLIRAIRQATGLP
jgi:CheY-like chemotaxis protein